MNYDLDFKCPALSHLRATPALADNYFIVSITFDKYSSSLNLRDKLITDIVS